AKVGTVADADSLKEASRAGCGDRGIGTIIPRLRRRFAGSESSEGGEGEERKSKFSHEIKEAFFE
ncbi:MAG: hypothetical protein ACSHWY_15315, partial [Octadecabacter sp.]